MHLERPNHSPLVSPGKSDHHVADLSATFAADVTLAAAQSKLREHGQWLPIDGDPESALGSLVEQNSTGPLRLGFGAWRDLLLGAQFTNGSGELITAGGRTAKNVAGYDLTKFMVGQFGVFGKLVTITTRAYKAPDTGMLASFEPDVKKLNALLVTACRPQWAMLTKENLLCGYLGDRATVDFYAASVPRYGSIEIKRQSLDDDIALRRALWQSGASLDGAFRASVPPMRIASFASSISITDWRADAAFGIIIGPCGETDRSAIHKAASSAGGSALTFDPSGKPTDLVLNSAQQKILERLKYAFDSDGKLNPLPATAS